MSENSRGTIHRGVSPEDSIKRVERLLEPLPSKDVASGRWPHLSDSLIKARIWARCVPDGACWRWQGHKNTKGYGEATFNKKRAAVHRWICILTIGPIPSGMLVCHTCDVRDCCTPTHLFLGTEQDNNRDCAAKGRHHNTVKTHCPKGHPYDAENTYVKNGLRNCRTCHRERSRKASRENRV